MQVNQADAFCDRPCGRPSKGVRLKGAAPEIWENFLRPDFYPHPVEAITHLQTHISHIFLTGKLAYKVKKPVNFGFLDFSTLAARQKYCQMELDLNRRLAPSVYLQVMAVVLGNSALSLVPLAKAREDEIREVCVQMAQMDQARQMDALLARGEVQAAQVRELARLLCRFYQKAARGPEVDFFGRPAQIRLNLEENFRQAEDYQDVAVAPARLRAIRDYALAFWEQNRELFERRVREGRIVDGHGDLHSGNINLPAQGGPLVFDCIEFNERFRYQDAASDLAFLAMDLEFHGRPDLARELAREFTACGGDEELGRLLDFYKCYRAMVRAKIFGFAFDDEEVPLPEKFTDLGKARSYFRLAAGYAGGEPPYFMACLMGRMGTGKTFLAKRLAAATGWVALHSDQVRKQRAGLSLKERRYDQWGQGLYDQKATDDTYQALLQGAEARLAQGASVIVDASFGRERWRRRFLAQAQRYGARPLFVEVTARDEVLKDRLAAREAKGGSLSDGRLDLLASQAAAWEDAGGLVGRHGLRMDGGAPAEAKLAKVLARLKEMGYAG